MSFSTGRKENIYYKVYGGFTYRWRSSTWRTFEEGAKREGRWEYLTHRSNESPPEKKIVSKLEILIVLGKDAIKNEV